MDLTDQKYESLLKEKETIQGALEDEKKRAQEEILEAESKSQHLSSEITALNG